MLIHASHQPEARHHLASVALLTLLLIFLYCLPESMKSAGVGNYLPLHMALETLSIVVDGLVFTVIWSVRRERIAGNFIVLAAVFLGVAVLDFAHMLSANGMPDFITPSSSDKAIYFWLCARMLCSLALVAVAFAPWKPASRALWWWLLPIVGIVVAAVLANYFYAWIKLPPLFIPGVGLTRFKQGIEFVLLGLCLVAAARFFWLMRQPRVFHASGLFAASLILAQSAVFFTGFTTVTGVYILAGHIYKGIAFVFIYHAIFVETVRRPYLLLRDSRQQMRATIEAVPDWLFEMDAQGRYQRVFASRAGLFLARARESLLGRTADQVLRKDAAATLMRALAEADREGVSRGGIISAEDADGEERWFELSVSRKAGVIGHETRFLVISRDITDFRKAEEEARRLSSALAQNPVAIVITDLEGHIEYINDAFTRSYGYAAEEVMGVEIDALLRTETMAASQREDLRQAVRQGKAWQGEILNRAKSGAELLMSVLVYPLRDAAGAITHYLSHQQDITERHRAALQIEHLSNYDQLTGLPNRGMLAQHFDYAQARETPLALFWLDVDRFKDINDSLGHGAGDQLLKEISRRLHALVDTNAMLSRQSGDEFVITAPDLDQAAAASLAQSMLQALTQPVRLVGQDVYITVSIGIALSPQDGNALETLLKCAEMAMYRIKDDGRNGYRFFQPEMQQQTVRTLALGNALQQAEQRGELRLVYQPQVCLADGRIVGVEALLRWDSAQWGAVSPGEFVPIAEANGSIVPIGEWALRTAMMQLRSYLDRGLPPMTMAVNLSAVQFNQPGIADAINEILQTAGVPAELLELELTEAVAMKAPEVAARRIDELSRYGIRLAIDDFGTGYSSLNYLKQFKIDKIKIDQSFVRDLSVDPDDQAITATIINMAHSLGMRAIAEGVETSEQLAYLQKQGCDEAQGYLFGKPMPPEEFESFVHARTWQRPAARTSPPHPQRGAR